MLPTAERLSSADFDRAFRHPEAQMLRHPCVHLKFAPSGEPGLVRAAFVVPKKQGKAVKRNAARRRLRERYRLHPLRAAEGFHGYDLIFMSTPATAGASIKELDEAVTNVLTRAVKRLAKASEPPDEDTPSSSPEPPASKHAEEPHPAPGPLTALALTLIRFYQRGISPALPPSCRFYPTCSRYTYQAIERFGVFPGTALGLRRVCRCHPWHPGGFDPVPESLISEAGFGAVWRKWFLRKSRPPLGG